ncbi:MAG: hypothetical protein CME66_13240 [Halobacteriovoraceae bacterium]|jgi:hypothetical protein|nr:hypothetical protein [Halobacteriovoraceae bacterium]|tara:strand:- start:299 stop:526 length:228 start_codon:yes stop_codon:yes gene_type:complete
MTLPSFNILFGIKNQSELFFLFIGTFLGGLNFNYVNGIFFFFDDKTLTNLYKITSKFFTQTINFIGFLREREIIE